MTNSAKILVGKIVAPQGIRGDVRIQTYTATPGDFRDLPVYGNNINIGDIKFLRLLNPTSTVIVAHVRGIDDRTSAEALRGIELFINRDSLPTPDEGEYYQTDLIGMRVMRNNTEIGTVAGFQNFGAGDIIELENGNMVSFLGATVDLEARLITVR